MNHPVKQHRLIAVGSLLILLGMACMIPGAFPGPLWSSKPGTAPGDNGNGQPPAPQANASPTPTRVRETGESTLAPTIQPATRYELIFDSTMRLLHGNEQVRARVLLSPVPGKNILKGTAPLQIVQADSDNLGGGIACPNNKFVEVPGDFLVSSARLVFKPGSRDLQDVVLVYSLDPEIKCTEDGSHGPNNWNLFWMVVFENHFTHTDDKLDDSSDPSLITSSGFQVIGQTARKVFQWQGEGSGSAESTTIDIHPVN
jgi:hypothetical protein